MNKGLQPVLAETLTDWWDRRVYWFALSTAWLLAMVTVVLGPPAIVALGFAASTYVYKGVTPSPRELLEAAWRYFWVGWLWVLLNLLVAFILYINFQFYSAMPAPWNTALVVVFLIVTALWLGTQFYAIPYVMKQEEVNLFLAYRNGLLTTLASPLFTLFLLTLSLSFWLISSPFMPAMLNFPYPYFLLLILGVPAFVALLATHALRDRLVVFGILAKEKSGTEEAKAEELREAESAADEQSTVEQSLE